MTLHEYSSKTIFSVFSGISFNLIPKSLNEDSSNFLPNSIASLRLIDFNEALIECLAFSVTTKLNHPGSGRKFFFVLIFIRITHPDSRQKYQCNRNNKYYSYRILRN